MSTCIPALVCIRWLEGRLASGPGSVYPMQWKARQRPQIKDSKKGSPNHEAGRKPASRGVDREACRHGVPTISGSCSYEIRKVLTRSTQATFIHVITRPPCRRRLHTSNLAVSRRHDADRKAQVGHSNLLGAFLCLSEVQSFDPGPPSQLWAKDVPGSANRSEGDRR